MSDVLIAFIGLFGSAAGAFAGIVMNTKLTNWRLDKIEEKLELLDTHTEKITKLTDQIEELKRDIAELKGARK